MPCSPRLTSRQFRLLCALKGFLHCNSLEAKSSNLCFKTLELPCPLEPNRVPLVLLILITKQVSANRLTVLGSTDYFSWFQNSKDDISTFLNYSCSFSFYRYTKNLPFSLQMTLPCSFFICKKMWPHTGTSS